jgi:hypothetical protein
MTMRIVPLDSRQRPRSRLIWVGAAVAAAIMALALALGLYGLFPWGAERARSTESQSPANAAPGDPSVVFSGSLPSAAASGIASTPGGAANAPEPPTVQITLKTVPSVHASVTMGKTRLGSISPRAPLVVERRRDSGPLDLVIHSPGFLAVHTRAYTFDNNVVEVRLTRLDKKNTLYGYREPLPPEEDGGVAPPP